MKAGRNLGLAFACMFAAGCSSIASHPTTTGGPIPESRVQFPPVADNALGGRFLTPGEVAPIPALPDTHPMFDH